MYNYVRQTSTFNTTKKEVNLMLNKKLNKETAFSTLPGRYRKNFIYTNKSEEKVT